MIKVVSVKFKDGGKAYYFDPRGLTFEKGDGVIVETAKAQEFATVVSPVTEVEDEQVIQPLMPVVRKATEEDLQRVRELDSKRDETLRVAREKIAARGLEMKPVGCEYAFDGSRVTIYFTAPSRVDFRELIRDLSSAFHMRIELRQINIRDEIRVLGALGPCGRECCCVRYLPEAKKTSVKMAKNQNLSLNPGKISGMCGKLMCCLAYEDDYYSEVQKKVPKIGSEALTPGGKGMVVNVDMFRLVVKVRIEDGDAISYKDYGVDEISFVRGGVRFGRTDLTEEKIKPAAEPRIAVEEREPVQDGQGADKPTEKHGKRDFKNKPKKKNEPRGNAHTDDGATGEGRQPDGREHKKNKNKHGKNPNRSQSGERGNAELEKTNQGLDETNTKLVKTNKLKVAKKPKKFGKTDKNS